MATVTPVHAGYTILNGRGAGPNGGRILVWAEYQTAAPIGNATPLELWFYAALDPNHTSSTAYASGLGSQLYLDGTLVSGVENGAYDFTSPDRVNLLGSYKGLVAHDADGTKTVTVEGSFTTLSSYITGGSISAQVTLPAIYQAATLQGTQTVLSEGCCVTWTPASPDHSFVLAFALGDWSLTTGRLYPNTRAAYRYTDTVLPLEVARQFSGATGEVTATLTTYREDQVLGQSQCQIPVVLPENESTRPQVTATLQPLCPLFEGQYVRLLGKVEATVEAADPFGAAITGYQLQVDRQVWSGTVSGPLEQAGRVEVTVTATSSRGFTGSYTETITVLPYDPPALQKAVAFRCLSDGAADPGGTYLYLAAQASYSPLEGSNQVYLRWRCKEAGGQWNSARLLTQGVAEKFLLEKNKAYTVQLLATDTAGSTDQAQIHIPMEQVYMHRTANALGLGGYAQGEDRVDVYWDIYPKKGVSGAYIRTLTPGAGFTLTFPQGSGTALLLGGGYRGLLRLSQGEASWEGSTGVTLQVRDTQVDLTLAEATEENMLILSPDPIEIEKEGDYA